MNPNPTWIDRVSVNPNECEDRFKDIVNEIESVVNQCSDGQINYGEGNEKLKELGNRLLAELNYGSYGSSNGVWGKQYRVGSQPYLDDPEDVSKLEDTVSAAGFIYDGPIKDNGSIISFSVFIPDIRRYLPFDHEYNRPNSDAVIVKIYDDVAVCSENEELLSDLQATFGCDEDRQQFGNIAYDGQLAVDELSDYFESNSIPYSVTDATVFGIPEYQYRPNAENMYSVKRKEGGWPIEYKAHVIRGADDTAKCGVNTDDECSVVSEEVLSSIRNRDGFTLDMCGHSACTPN